MSRRPVLAVVVAGWLVGALAAPAAADPDGRERFGLELRIGGALPRNEPSFALYASVGLSPGWSAEAGYEGVRVFDVSLPRDCVTTVDPAIVSGIRAGIARRVRLPRNFGLRLSFLAGVDVPDLTIGGAFPDGVSGLVLEVGVDAELFWSWRALSFGVYAGAAYAGGTLSNAPCPTLAGMDAEVNEVDGNFGLAFAVRL